jgi:hypothetical protein
MDDKATLKSCKPSWTRSRALSRLTKTSLKAKLDELAKLIGQSDQFQDVARGKDEP